MDKYLIIDLKDEYKGKKVPERVDDMSETQAKLVRKVESGKAWYN